MAGRTDAIYRRCPVWLQEAGISAYGLLWKRQRLGGVFQAQVAAFAGRDGLSVDAWHAYQTDRLRELLVHCFRRVPYYRRAWSALGVEEGDLARFEPEQLSALPLTEKEAIRRSPGDFLASPGTARRLHSMRTSGSTGTPLEVRLSTRTHQTWSAAYEVRCRRWAGVNHTMSRAMIGGRLVVPQAESGPPFWRHNWAERQLYLSAFHIAPANVPDYVRTLNRHRPDYLVGYASAHFFLARMIEEAGLPVHSPKAILTSSEKLTDAMRETLSRVYRCEVFDGYSGVEPCCLASECGHHRLHVSPDVGVVELLDEAGRPAPPGREGEIIATGLLNFDQPLVRYRMGDLAAWAGEICPCGRRMPVLSELVGRLEDTLVGSDGRETVRFHGIFLGMPGIREGQIVQEAIDRLVVRVVAPEGLSEADRVAIVRRCRERLGPVAVEIMLVPAIERTSRGKFRAVISRVPRAGATTAR
jgi:phenylacetate-CoA ligase